MKNKTFFNKVSSLTIVLIILSSCDSFIEVDLPPSQLTADAVFEAPSTATAAMVDIYAKMRDTGLLTGQASGITCQLGNYADELAYYGSSGLSTEHFFNNNVLVGDSNILEWWNSTYSQIYQVNAVYEGVTNSETLPDGVRSQLRGEAVFTRALLHFYLLQIYGGIPYIITTNYQTNSNVSRLSESDVYNRIEADLLEAIMFLPDEYIGENRTRPNRATAHALLSRVFLYQSKWTEAANEASKIINHTTLYNTETDISNTFKIGSTATIWQLASAASGENTHEAATFIFNAGPPPLTALTEGLINSFELGDSRKNIWTVAVTDGAHTWYHPNKYTTVNNTGVSIEYSVVFRLAEQYLIRAEARAHQGDLNGARADIDVVRNSAGLGNTDAITFEAILLAISNERKIEFFAEFGHRFFDLKRTNSLGSVLTPVKQGWNADDKLLPLPERELQINPNLNPQNPGY